jgi:hypothetical protein
MTVDTNVCIIVNRKVYSRAVSKCPINRVTIPKPVYSHTLSCDDVVILFSCLRLFLRSDSSLQDFRVKLYIYFSSSMCATGPAHLALLELIAQIMWEYQVIKLSLSPHHFVTRRSEFSREHSVLRYSQLRGTWDVIPRYTFRVRVPLRLAVYRQSVRLGGKPLDDHDQ